jgi:hypothetical protein
VQVMSLVKEGVFLGLKHGEKTVRSSGVFASNNFFETFTFSLAAGNPEQVLDDRNAIVISENLAQSLYGSAGAAVGKSMEWEVFGKKMQSLVSGVFDKLPANSSMEFDFVMTQDLLIKPGAN